MNQRVKILAQRLASQVKGLSRTEVRQVLGGTVLQLKAGGRVRSLHQTPSLSSDRGITSR